MSVLTVLSLLLQFPHGVKVKRTDLSAAFRVGSRLSSSPFLQVPEPPYLDLVVEWKTGAQPLSPPAPKSPKEPRVLLYNFVSRTRQTKKTNAAARSRCPSLSVLGTSRRCWSQLSRSTIVRSAPRNHGPLMVDRAARRCGDTPVDARRRRDSPSGRLLAA